MLTAEKVKHKFRPKEVAQEDDISSYLMQNDAPPFKDEMSGSAESPDTPNNP